MSDEIRPPPFPPAKDVETEPGLGLLALKAENAKLRQALASSMAEDSPPPLPALRMSRVKLVGKWAAIGTLLGLAMPVLEHFVPQYADLIHELAKAIGP